MGGPFACARTSNHAVVAGHPDSRTRRARRGLPAAAFRHADGGAEATCQCQAPMGSKSPLIPGADARLAPAAARGFLFNRSSRQVRAF